MHKRLTPHLADGRRFLLGDAGHLSSPFGGEGLNSGLHDAHNLAWKLALELRGRGRPGLTDTFAVERGAAGRHVLAVSDRLHQLVQTAVEAARTGRPPSATAPPSPAQAAALVRARCMLDVAYAGSPLTGRYPSAGDDGLLRRSDDPVPAPGERYPGRAALRGTGHHVLLAGRPSRRWTTCAAGGPGSLRSAPIRSWEGTGPSSSAPTATSGSARPRLMPPGWPPSTRTSGLTSSRTDAQLGNHST